MNLSSWVHLGCINVLGPLTIIAPKRYGRIHLEHDFQSLEPKICEEILF
jgi:hypothetical protein